MAGHFELISDREGRCRVTLTDPDGKEIAVSIPFTDRKSAVEAIRTIREVAAAAPVRDRTSNRRTAAGARFNAARQRPQTLSSEHHWTKEARHDPG